MAKKTILGMAVMLAGVHVGALITKDAPNDDATLELLTKSLEDLTGKFETKSSELETHYKELHAHFAGRDSSDAELKAAVEKHTADYAGMTEEVQQLRAAIEGVKKELDTPRFTGSEKDREDAMTKASIELQRRVHLNREGNDTEFKEDMNALVDHKAYKSAARKLVSLGGIETKSQIVSKFTEAERKAFDMGGMDSAFFSPQMLGIEVDCTVECAELIDLYDSVTVSRSKFMYPQVTSYGDIGQYDCDAKCDAEFGPEGNIQWLSGATYDFRGVFCFQKKVLQEANYDLLDFMFRSAARSHRINRNAAMITGDGVKQPLGWLKADVFTKVKTGALKFTHQDYRRFISSAPVEYGPVVATMHQNVFGYLASAVDNTGRFIFGDGLMSFSPSDTVERIRISNCLPDPTDGGTLGNAASPFVAGDFILAAGNWERAYTAVSKRPMFMEQYIGGSTAWCVSYQFGAEDGGFVACPPAARTLQIGA